MPRGRGRENGHPRGLLKRAEKRGMVQASGGQWPGKKEEKEEEKMGNTEMERVTFFRSYFDVEQQLSSKRDRLAFLEAILFYAFEGRVPEITPEAKIVFTLVKPMLDISRKRSVCGKNARNPAPGMPENTGGNRHFAETECYTNKNMNMKKEYENEKKEWKVRYD
jgi:hypothetical protein